jgi:excisionase family DNA binding protein
VIRVTEAARRLDISRSKAYALVKQGQLPSIKVGATVRVPVAALEQWLQQQTVGGNSEA